MMIDAVVDYRRRHNHGSIVAYNYQSEVCARSAGLDVRIVALEIVPPLSYFVVLSVQAKQGKSIKQERLRADHR